MEMTREEAEKYIKSKMCNDCSVHLGGGKCLDNCKVIEAIKALEQEPCGDAVSRQVAIDTIESWLSCDDYNKAERHIMRATQSMLYDLPLVNPQVKVGHWVENDRGIPICSCCREYKYKDIDGSIYDDTWFPNYCPNCGAKMIEPKERSCEG